MDVVDKFYSGYGEQPNQGVITSSGNSYLDSKPGAEPKKKARARFPKLTKIVKATVQ